MTAGNKRIEAVDRDCSRRIEEDNIIGGGDFGECFFGPQYIGGLVEPPHLPGQSRRGRQQIEFFELSHRYVPQCSLLLEQHHARCPFRRLGNTHHAGEKALWVEVDDEYPVAAQPERGSHMNSGGRFSGTSFMITDG